MQKTVYDILIISSMPPSHSSGIGNAHIRALEAAGHHVDYMTTFDYPDKEENIITLLPGLNSSKTSKVRKYIVLPIRKLLIYTKIYTFIAKIKYRNAKRRINRTSLKDLMFLYPDESNPPIPPSLIVKNIKKEYDAVITGFWEGLLNSTTLAAIYERLHCPIIIPSPDMAPITGGCYYFGKCRNFHNGCGKCPLLESSETHDQSRKNFELKKLNYSKINCAFLGNAWMRKHAEKSNLFSNIFHLEVMIDPNVFSPSDMGVARMELGIENNNQFLILIASSSLPRKGIKDIVYAIEQFINNTLPDKNQAVEFIVIGDDYFTSLTKGLKIRTYYFGTVNTSQLVNCYRAANLFISASNDDAGPSMINQSLMCGTPVVCYDNGTALDVVVNNVSGHKSAPGDKDGLAQGIIEILSLSSEKYNEMRKASHDMAMRHNSPEVCVRSRIAAIETLKKLE